MMERPPDFATALAKLTAAVKSGQNGVCVLKKNVVAELKHGNDLAPRNFVPHLRVPKGLNATWIHVLLTETGGHGQKPRLVTSRVAMVTSIDTENAITQRQLTEENIAVGHLLMLFLNATCSSVQFMGTGETGENGVYATKHAEEVCPSEGDIAIALHQDIMADTVKEKRQWEFLAISRNATELEYGLL